MHYGGLWALCVRVGTLLGIPPVRKKCRKGPKWRAAYYRSLIAYCILLLLFLYVVVYYYYYCYLLPLYYYFCFITFGRPPFWALSTYVRGDAKQSAN